jgi:hypothetical protein
MDMTVEQEGKREGEAPAAIPRVLSSLADLDPAGRRFSVRLAVFGQEQMIPVRFVTAEEEAQIERELPYPAPPLVDGIIGGKIANDGDAEHKVRCIEVDEARELRFVSELLRDSLLVGVSGALGAGGGAAARPSGLADPGARPSGAAAQRGHRRGHQEGDGAPLPFWRDLPAGDEPGPLVRLDCHEGLQPDAPQPYEDPRPRSWSLPLQLEVGEFVVEHLGGDWARWRSWEVADRERCIAVERVKRMREAAKNYDEAWRQKALMPKSDG